MNGVLVDENIPGPLTLPSTLPVFYVKVLGQSWLDSVVWEHARQNSLVILTKDADFSDRMMRSLPPPWVIRFRIGNMRRARFLTFMSRVWPQVERLLPAHKLVNVYADRLEAVS